MPSCPHCGREVSVYGHLTGTRVYHPPPCDRWFLVVHRDGGTELFACEAPRQWGAVPADEPTREQGE